MKNNIRTDRKSGLLFALGGVLLGAVGMFVLTSRGRPSAPSMMPGGVQAESPGRDPEAGEEGTAAGPITLSKAALETAGIRVETVRSSTSGESLTAPGTVEVAPNRSARITPPAPGKILRLLATPGDRVQAGQPLAVLDSYEVAQAEAAVQTASANVKQAQAGIQTARAEVAQAESGVASARAEVAQARIRQGSAETALARQRELASAGAFSQPTLQAAQSELASAQSELLQAQTELQSHTTALQRAERLFREELISRAELEQTQLEHRQDETRVERAQGRVDIAKQTLEREQKLFRGDLLNRREVQTAEADVRAAQGEVHKAQQGVTRAQQDVLRARKVAQAAQTTLQGAESALGAARTNLAALSGSGQSGQRGRLTLFAPLAGTVTERSASLGQAVERATTLFVVESLNAVIVNANVPESAVGRIRVGQPVEVTVAAYPQARFDGVVQSLAGRVDEKTRALPVRCLVENSGLRLRPEMFARVNLTVGKSTPGIHIPLSALDEHGDERHVYVEENGSFRPRPVQVGRRTDTSVEIVQGLKAGERIAVEGVFVLESESKKSELKGED